jgi:CBS domain-containing protein
MMKPLKVRDYMSTELVTFVPTDGVMQAMMALLERGISGAPLVDADSRALVGMLSEVDLIGVVLQDTYYNEPAGIVTEYMQSEVESVGPDMDILSLAQQFVRHHRRRYPVLEHGALIGQISRRDVLRAAMQFSSD